MTKEIKNIFKNNIEAFNYLDKAITYIRLQNYYKALMYSTRIIEKMNEIVSNIVTYQSYFNEFSMIVDMNQINDMLQNLLKAQENSDYVLLADLYEKQLIPFLENIQQTIICKEDYLFDQKQYDKNLVLLKAKNPQLANLLKHTDTPEQLMDKYSIEYTSCGSMTLALYDNGKKYYLHSNGNVFHEAGLIARDWFDDDKTEYIVYGLGFGYHIYELMELDETITI